MEVGTAGWVPRGVAISSLHCFACNSNLKISAPDHEDQASVSGRSRFGVSRGFGERGRHLLTQIQSYDPAVISKIPNSLSKRCCWRDPIGREAHL